MPSPALYDHADGDADDLWPNSTPFSSAWTDLVLPGGGWRKPQSEIFPALPRLPQRGSGFPIATTLPTTGETAMEELGEAFMTPAVRGKRGAFASRPPDHQRSAPMPPLMLALTRNDSSAVRTALDEDPQAAADLFWDHDLEPPLCFAVRCGCDVEIIEALLQNKADPEVVDAKGRTPLSILASLDRVLPMSSFKVFMKLSWDDASLRTIPNSEVNDDSVERSITVAQALVAAGARPWTADAVGNVPINVAADSGNMHLVSLWQEQYVQNGGACSACIAESDCTEAE